MLSSLLGDGTLHFGTGVAPFVFLISYHTLPGVTLHVLT